MKKYLFPALTAVVLLLVFSLFQSCKKNSGGGGALSLADVYALNSPRTTAISNLYASGIGAGNWRIGSETVSPAINGNTSVEIDTCDKSVTYNFQALTMGNHDSGYITIHYYNSPCNGPRPTSSEPKNATYSLDVAPNAITFSDNSANNRVFMYNILKVNKDSLVLRNTISGYTYTKVYLIEK